MIQEENIVFLKTQVMDDVPEGGGAATGNVVPDGGMNNVFPDISDLDRTYGRINLRKLALAVRSVDTDIYGGAKAAVTDLPLDEAVGYTLFETGDAFDTRTEAASRVEAYLYKGPMWLGYLFENHIAGMRAIRIFQRPGNDTPPIGRTLCLVQAEGSQAEVEQYVRVTSVESVDQTFSDSNSDFVRTIVTLGLSDALRHDFLGHSPNRYDAYALDTRTRVRDTQVADATRYYGAAKVATSAAIGDAVVNVESIFTALVPSGQTESPLVNRPMAGAVTQTIDAGGGRMVEVSQTAHTRGAAVTAETRRLNWIETLKPIPAPGSLSVSYRAQGSWYSLRDDGAGAISGSGPSVGAGTISYVSGAAQVTLGALPDVGSSIIWVWASPAHYTQRIGAVADNQRAAEVALGEPVAPASLVLTWISGGATKTATCGVDGVITGDGSGYLAHATGDLWLYFSSDATPDPSSNLGVAYNRVSVEEQTFTGVSPTDGLAALDLGESVRAGSLLVRWDTKYTKQRDRRQQRRISGKGTPFYIATESATLTDRLYHEASDDGAGHLGDAPGSVNYLTGEIVLAMLPSVSQSSWDASDGPTGKSWVVESGSDQHTNGSGVVIVRYTPGGAPNSDAVSLTLDLPPLAVRVLPELIDESIMPGSLRFTLGSKVYEDRGDAILYTDINPQTGAGIVAGAVDYLNGKALLTIWAGVSAGPVVHSCLTRYGLWVATDAAFRTGVSPLKPQSLAVSITAEDGTLLTAVADEDGVIAGADILGSCNYEMGTAALEFGHDNGGTWVPRRVDPTSLRYNAVGYTYLPLDAEILGIDAVRLPSDGRVPIYRAGDVVIVLHTQTLTGVTPTLNVAVSVGRTRLAWVRVLDATGARVSSEKYTLDRAAGTVTFTDLAGVTTPVFIRHTVGDLRLVTDVQITGALTLGRPLSHTYPAGEALVASCLLFGDRRARVSGAWDQATFDGIWQDSIRGDPATAQLNLIDYPITVTNEGADTDRWVFRITNTATNQWELISEHRGLVWAGTYEPYVSGQPADVAPINPRTRTLLEDGYTYVGGVPYLTIPQRANGGGWSVGQCVRINTVGAIAEFWVARSIQQSDEPADPAAPDGCELYALGNVDRP